MKRAKKTSRQGSAKRVKKSIKGKSVPAATKRREDVQRLVELFKVNLVELEHQNQELRMTEEELEASRNRYVNLFDFSPVPYFSLDPGGIIKEVNISACRMLCVDRNKLTGNSINAYIPFAEKKTFQAFMKSVFDADAKQSCRIEMFSKDKRVFHVLLEGVKYSDTMESGERCQVAVIDLTEYKKLEETIKELSEELKLLKSAKRGATRA